MTSCFLKMPRLRLQRDQAYEFPVTSRGRAGLHGFVALNALAIGSCCPSHLLPYLDSRGQRQGLTIFFDPANIYCMAGCVPHVLIYAENI